MGGPLHGSFLSLATATACRTADFTPWVGAQGVAGGGELMGMPDRAWAAAGSSDLAAMLMFQTSGRQRHPRRSPRHSVRG